MQDFLFWVIAVLTGVSAIATVVTQNIVRAATWLLFALGGVSGIFFLLGADLVGTIQLLVYVGGTLVLVVFGVMLTAQGPFVQMKASAGEWAVTAVAGLLLISVLALAIGTLRHEKTGELQVGPPENSVTAQYAPDKSLAQRHDDDPAASPHTLLIGQGLLGKGVGPAHRENVGRQSKVVRTGYLFPFEIVSVHLLVVLIGAAYLARAKRRREAAT